MPILRPAIVEAEPGDALKAAAAVAKGVTATPNRSLMQGTSIPHAALDLASLACSMTAPEDSTDHSVHEADAAERAIRILASVQNGRRNMFMLSGVQHFELPSIPASCASFSRSCHLLMILLPARSCSPMHPRSSSSS